MVLQIHDDKRVRTLTLDRPDALNAFNIELYDATARALREAAEEPGVAVVLLTGNGRAFSAGTDLLEMARIAADPDFDQGEGGVLAVACRRRRAPTQCRPVARRLSSCEGDARSCR